VPGAKKDDGIETIAQGILVLLLILNLTIGVIGGFAQTMVSLLILGVLGLVAFGARFPRPLASQLKNHVR